MECEVIFMCYAETEENEKFRHYYEAIQRLKDGRLPTSTQLIKSSKLAKKDADPHLSILGAKQLLNIRLKLEENKFWSSNVEFCVGYGPSRASVESFEAIVPESFVASSAKQTFLFPHKNKFPILSDLRKWIEQAPSKRLFLIGSREYFTSLLKTPILLRNCDVYRVSCRLPTNIDTVPVIFSNLRLLYRSDFADFFPTDTIFSWKHILYSCESDSSGDSYSSKSIRVGYANGFATSREDINPMCRICQVSYFEMPNKRLIKPCKCSGSVKYVHKECLNQWRATSAFAFTTCNMCHYDYKIRSPLMAKYLVNEDFTFLLALLLMVPLTYVMGIYSSRLLSWTNSDYAHNVILFPYDFKTISQSMLLAGLLGSNVIGLFGFFCTTSPFALISLLFTFCFALYYKLVAVFCILVGFGTALREFHLFLMIILRKLNDRIGNVIVESS